MTDPNRIVVVEGVTSSFIATDTVTVSGATQHFQYVKLAWGPDDTVNLVDSATGKHIPVQLYAGGSAITTTGNALDVNIGASDITVATLPSGGTLDSVTIVGGTLDGVTIVGGTIDNISSATVSGGTLDSVTIVGGTIDTISSATVVGGTLDAVYVQGATIGQVTNVAGVSAAVVVGGTIDTISSVTALGGGTIDTISTITNNVSVTATDLDIRGLTFGELGASAAAQDSVVVQGASGAFPVTTLISGASAQGVASTPIGSSGDALKVAVVGAEIAATVNVGTEVAVFSNGTHLQVSGSSAGASDAHPIIVGGCAAAGAIPVSLHGACGGATIDVTGSHVKIDSGSVTATVSATDLDIRGLSFGAAGHTLAKADATDSVVIQGATAMYPVHNVLHGFTSDEVNSVPLGLTFDGATPILRTSLDPRFATNANALQVQGRSDGLTLNPITIIGLTGSVANPLIGVTFSSLATQPVVGGHSADTLKTFLHGICLATDIGDDVVLPVGVSGDALHVYMDDISINASIESTSISLSSIDAAANLAVKGAAAGTNGVFVTGTGGTLGQWPVMVSGYSPEGVSAGANVYPVGVTYEHFNQLEGLSGGITSINNILFGISAGIDGVTTGLFDVIGEIHDQLSFTNIEAAVGVKGDSQTDIVTALSELHAAYLTDAETPAAATIPVSVAAPDTIRTVKLALSANTTTQISTNADPLDSGVRVKVPSSTATTANVFVGGEGVNAGNGYLLEAGDDVFIEIESMSKVFVFATEAVDVYAIGS